MKNGINKKNGKKIQCCVQNEKKLLKKLFGNNATIEYSDYSNLKNVTIYLLLSLAKNKFIMQKHSVNDPRDVFEQHEINQNEVVELVKKWIKTGDCIQSIKTEHGTIEKELKL
jgi:hypothetical protein